MFKKNRTFLSHYVLLFVHTQLWSADMDVVNWTVRTFNLSVG